MNKRTVNRDDTNQRSAEIRIMGDQKGEFQKEGDKVLLEATFKQYRPS